MSLSYLLLMSALALPQARPETPPPKTTSALKLTVKGGVYGSVETEVKTINAGILIERLAAELKIPITGSKLVMDQPIEIPAKRITVLELLARVAPVALADLEIGGGSVEEQWLGIHLTGYNEKEPVRPVRQNGVLIAAGVIHEDGTVSVAEGLADDAALKAIDEDESEGKQKTSILAVVVQDGRVSLRCRDQHLGAILNEVAVKAHVPFNVQGEMDSTPVDIKVKDLPLRDLPVALGRSDARIVIRRNLIGGEEFVTGILAGRRPQPPSARY